MNTLALLPNLAGPDMIIIFIIVLIMFGAKKLPEFAKGLGQAVREFSKAKDSVNQELHSASQMVEHTVYHPPVDTHALPTAGTPVPSPVPSSVSLAKPDEHVAATAQPSAPAAPAHTAPTPSPAPAHTTVAAAPPAPGAPAVPAADASKPHA